MAEIREINLGCGRVLKVTPVFDSYWKFAAERQAVFMRRLRNEPAPWTRDHVLGAYRFTNVYRASDRVTQYLIRHVLYEGVQTEDEIFFRAILFRIFNRIETWQALVREVGEPSWKKFKIRPFVSALDRIKARDGKLYSAAYIMPCPRFGGGSKHENHLRLLEEMVRSGAATRVARARSLGEVFLILRVHRSIGDFLAYQFAIDLNYSNLVDFSEMDFVVPGPGARDGIRKCIAARAGLDDADVIRVVTELADSEFARLRVRFETLWGRRLQLVDCQNLFCEIDKYARIAHPEVQSRSGRTQIKQRFKPRSGPLPQWYPPKWRIAAATRCRSDEFGG